MPTWLTPQAVATALTLLGSIAVATHQQQLAVFLQDPETAKAITEIVGAGFLLAVGFIHGYKHKAVQVSKAAT